MVLSRLTFSVCALLVLASMGSWLLAHAQDSDDALAEQSLDRLASLINALVGSGHQGRSVVDMSDFLPADASMTLERGSLWLEHRGQRLARQVPDGLAMYIIEEGEARPCIKAELGARTILTLECRQNGQGVMALVYIENFAVTSATASPNRSTSWAWL